MSSKTKWLICLALGLVTLALYLPTLNHAFLGYDDQQYVTENGHVRGGVTGPGLAWAFGYRAGNWHPLTWVSHMLDCQLYDLRPAGHHLTNVLLHVANTVLLFLILNRLTGAAWRSAAVAALFGWHPLHVESVAWVAERKDVLSTLFFMLTLWAYARYADPVKAEGRMMNDECRIGKGASSESHSSFIIHHSSFYILSLFFFALGLMSKPMLVTLPFVLLLLEYWPLRRWQAAAGNRQALLLLLGEKVPLLALSAVGCVLTLAAQEPAVVSTRGLPILERVAHTLLAYVHYVGALLAPRRMAIYYPYQRLVPAWEVIVAGIVLAGVTVAVIRLSARRPYLPMGWFWFLGMLVPVVGLVQVGDQAWADRYTYLPSVGLFIAVVWALGDWAAGTREPALARIRKQPAKPDARPAQGRGLLLGGLAAAAGAGMLIGTSLQLRYWKDTRTLFEHAAQVTHNNPLAASLLGSLLEKEGKFAEAIEYYRAALRYTPGYPEAHFFLGHALDQQGKLAEAIVEYRKALWFKPMQEQTHLFLGAALAKQQSFQEAAEHYHAALKLNPESAIAYNNLGKLRHAEGRLDEAITYYRTAVKVDPAFAQARNNLGVLLLQKGQLAEGTAELREALRLKPDEKESQINLAQALAQQEQWREAADLFAKSVTAATADPNVHCLYADTLAHLQKTREAMSHYASALLLQQDLPAALDGLSWILATDANDGFRNGAEAVRMSDRACELTGRKDPAKLKTLAAAYAEAGRFPEAVATAQAAHDLAAQASRKALADECARMLEQFKAAKPWRQSK
jgi:protein O-mannosyl-transferase